MHSRPIQAAPPERVPITLWGRSKVRTVLAAVAASAAALVPTVMVASPAYAGTIANLTIADAANYEGGNLVFKVTYTGTAATSLTITAAGGSATGATALDSTTGNKDYKNNGFTTVDLPASSTTSPSTATVVVYTANDDDATTETFTLTATDGNADTKTATGTIYALTESPAPTLSLSGPPSVSEAAGTATVVASLSSVLNHDVFIGLATSAPGGTHGTGTDAVSTGGINRDYTAAAADAGITIPAGQLTGSLNIAINDDTLDEVDTQYFTVTPTLVGGISSIPATLDIGIVDNDATPSVSIGDAFPAPEGGSASFPIKLSGLSERTVTVDFTTSSAAETATARAASDTDYTAVVSPSSVSFSPLQQTKYKTVALATDSILEGTEIFSASISNPSAGLTLGTPTTAVGTITDGAALPALQVNAGNPISYQEGDTGTTEKQIPVSVTWSGTRETPVKLDYSFTDVTATNGVDYKGTAGTITIPVSASSPYTTAYIPVTLVGDTNLEGTETFSIVLSSSNGTIATGDLTTKTVSLVETGENDVKPTWTTGDVSVPEGNSGKTMARVPITLSKAAAADVTFTASATGTPSAMEGGNATTTPGADDFDWPTPPTTVIKAGATTGYIDIPINGDTVYEHDESFNVQLTASGSIVDSTDTSDVLHVSRVVITNDDAKPSITFNNVSSSEGGYLRVNGTINGVSQSAYKIGFKVAAGTPDGATPDVDFDASAVPTASLDVNPGDTGSLSTLFPGSFPADVYLMPDNIDEATETFTVTATETTAVPYGFTTSVGTYKITDDPADMPPAASISDETVDEDEGSVDVHVKLTQVGDTESTQQAIVIPYMTADGSAKAPADYSKTEGTLTIEAGKTEATIKVPINNDKIKEGDENFYVKLGTPKSPAGATIAKGTAEVIINANDGGSGGDDDNPGQPSEPDQPGAPTIDAPKKIVGAVAVSITGEAKAGATVELWGTPMGSDDKGKKLAETKADEDGMYSFSRWIGQGYVFQTAVGDLYSEEAEVWVQQSPVFVASSPSAGKLSLAVQGNPRGPKQTVIVQRLVNGAWVNAWKGTTGSNNLWKATVSLKSKSTYSLRAFVAGYTPEGLMPGYTATKKVTIK